MPSVKTQTRLVLRFRAATTEDIQFMRTLEIKKAGQFSEETYLPPVPSIQQEVALNSLGLPLTPIEELGEWGAALFTPVSKDKQDDTSDLMLAEAMKPSKDWINVGDPNAPGKVFVEVLACNDLPNLDFPGLLSKNLTDPFCCLIMEDSVVNTSYISDNLNPRWMPTGDHRAFVFGVQHPSSHLYVGCFNYNSTSKIYNPLGTFRDWIHTPVGRVLINLTQFTPDTVYTLHYHLYEVSSESAKDRMAGNHNGTLIIRLRIQWDRQLLAGMRLPPEFHISVPRKHDYQTAMYTTVGEVSDIAVSFPLLDIG